MSKNDKITITEGELLEIISRAMINALKDNFIPPEEFTKKILKGYYDKSRKDLNNLLKEDSK